MALKYVLKKTIDILRVPVGFLMSFFAVILPWGLRNLYMKIIAFFIDIALHFDFVVNYFMEVGFSLEENEGKNDAR